MLVLLHALVIERGDELLDLFDKLLRLSDGRARRRVDEQRRRTARQRDELAALGRQLSMILLECVETGEVPFDRVRSEVGLERLQAAAAATSEQLTPIDEQQLDIPRRAGRADPEGVALVDADDGVRLVAGRLELSPPDALDENPAAVKLRAHLDGLMPHIDIPDLLAEVEGWTGFTGQLTHAAGATPRLGDLQQHLHAALLASGLNLGPTRMAECCPLSYRELAWATECYLGDEQLQAANDVLVDYPTSCSSPRTGAPARSQAPTGNAPEPAAARRPLMRWPASSGSAAAR